MSQQEQPKVYSAQEKLDLECLKLSAEIRTLNQSYFRNPGNWLTIVTLTITAVAAVWNFNVVENRSVLADIKLRSVKDTIKKYEAMRDTIIIAKGNAEDQLKELTDKVTLQAYIYDSLLTSGKLTEHERNTYTIQRDTFRSIAVSANKNAANLNPANAVFIVTFQPNADEASQKEQEGFKLLMNENYNDAAKAFTASENAKNGYHASYELAKLLRANAKAMNDAQVKREVLDKIYSKYSNFAPPEVNEWLKAQAGR